MLDLAELLFFLVSRCLDLLVGLLLLIVMAPLIALVVLALLAESRQPLLVRRPVRRNQASSLRLYRFRTALAGPFGRPMDTPLGDFLASTRLEDAPILLNILRADISLCGYALNRINGVQSD
ncbi:MAG: hypothetical protein GVY13_04205 [Alphaproteobacteria bacterium]|jgi:lipopolysaccharide/colanic/teichoic acid biosynthesis glycosyltransferase|nr:hypothetical protein [Alphaproteobacteria bacterium]